MVRIIDKTDMTMFKKIKSTLVVMTLILTTTVNAQTKSDQTLDTKQQAMVGIAALTGKGDLSKLPAQLHAGLDAGLSINQIKEALTHVYAYAGFPRSLRGLQTFMAVLDERKAKGI